MECDRCGNDHLDLLIIRQKESQTDTDPLKQIWTYICYKCLSYLNHHYCNTELVKEEWSCLR